MVNTNTFVSSNSESESFTTKYFNIMASVTEISKMFNEVGFEPLSIQTSTTNGLSHYVTVLANVVDEGKCYADMYVNPEETVYITVRISDHPSGLEMNCNGVCRNKMTFAAFSHLIKTGAIKA